MAKSWLDQIWSKQGYDRSKAPSHAGQKSTLIPQTAAKYSNVLKLTVHSNKDSGKTVDLRGGFGRIEYHESILQDCIRMVVVYTDTGNSTNNNRKGTNCDNTKAALEGLPITGSEKVQIAIKDAQDVELKLDMYVNQVEIVNKTTTQTDTALELASLEFLKNEKCRLKKRYTGKISQHVKRILTDKDHLGTQKDVMIEPTGGKNYNFIGNTNKPFYSINDLCIKAVPQTQGAEGNTAGFFFWETSRGFYFRSIDKMMAQSQKISIIYTATPGDDIPKGYNVKALDYTENVNINVQEKLMMGATTTGCITFNQRNCDFKIHYLDAKEQQKYWGLAGEELNIWNKELDTQDALSFDTTGRFTFLAEEDGTLPDGNTAEEQIEQSEEKRFDPSRVFNQAIMRYNSLFAATNTVTIPGDFSLHAGDIVFIDSPELKAAPKADVIDKDSGGKYLISDIAHLVTPQGTWTKLNLVRDSFGRVGKPSLSNTLSNVGDELVPDIPFYTEGKDAAQQNLKDADSNLSSFAVPF